MNNNSELQEFLTGVCARNRKDDYNEEEETEEEYLQRLREILEACLMVEEFRYEFSQQATHLFTLLGHNGHHSSVPTILYVLQQFVKAIAGQPRKVIASPPEVFEFIRTLYAHRHYSSEFFVLCMCYAHTSNWRQWTKVLPPKVPSPAVSRAPTLVSPHQQQQQQRYSPYDVRSKASVLFSPMSLRKKHNERPVPEESSRTSFPPIVFNLTKFRASVPQKVQ